MSSTSTASRGSTHSTAGSVGSMPTRKKPVDPIPTELTSSGSKLKQTAKQLQELLAQVAIVLKNASEYADLDQIIEQHAILQGDLERKQGELDRKKKELVKKDDEIKFLDSAKRLQYKELLEKYDEWRKGERELEFEITSLKDELKTTKDNFNSTNDDLTDCKKNLEQLNTSLTPLKKLDLNYMRNKIDKLFWDCFQIIQNEFNISLPDTILKNDSWVTYAEELKVALPLPPGNDESARLVRVAVVAHVLSKLLYSEVFRPCYIPSSASLSDSMKLILEDHFPSDKKPQMLRSLLLSTHAPGELNKVVQDRAKKSKQALVNKVKFMTNDGGKSFGNKVDRILQKAAELWVEIQHAEQMIHVAVEATDWPWSLLDEFGQEMPPRRDDFVNLFPTFVVRGEPDPLYDGVAVWKDQEHVRKADNDWERFQNQRTSLNGKSLRERRKRESISGRPNSIISTSQREGKGLSYAERSGKP
ncbi:hypothetical protein Egran_01193 [Elaphomyces granulatus]|uniref:Uncharacterized protein n=1 Tax=Elaphomyces granulatus TaxID=519963 RepID=A0A232M3U6_9EURO|nr:hypothetical protein Egran_01193 [Elaphomyces granulatus]